MYHHDGHDLFVIDGHMHFWDANPENWKNKYGESWIKCFYAYHSALSPADAVWPFEKFCRYGEEALVDDLFRNGYVDMAILNSTYLYEFYKNGFNSHAQNNIVKTKYPDRLLLCGSFDPREEESGFDAFRRMVAEYPISGLKLYTAEWYDGSRGWTLKQQVSVCLTYGLTMLAVIAPWTYHNWRLYHRFLPLTISAGVLWQGSPEFYHLVQRNRGHLDIWANELNPERNGGHDPFTIDGDQYFTRRALQSIRAEPGVYVTYSLKKAGYFWFGNPAAEWGYFALYDWQTLRQWYPYSSLKLLNMFMTRQLPLVALVALVFLAVRGGPSHNTFPVAASNAKY